jgi:hypothetical protein
MSKPSVTLNCPANQHSGANERIVEFSATVNGALAGGLIALTNRNDSLYVEVFRCDANVKVIAPHVPEGDSEPVEPKLTIPQLNNVGSGKPALLAQYKASRVAVRAVAIKLREAEDIVAQGYAHGRDYHTLPGNAIASATAEHEERKRKLSNMYQTLVGIYHEFDLLIDGIEKL